MDAPSSCGGRRLARQRSNRLQMCAPSSLQVHTDTAAKDTSGWNAVIPLLSPLIPVETLPRIWDVVEPMMPEGTDIKRQDHGTGIAWQHPAAPFYYEPPPPKDQGQGPAFLLPHCA